jgi:dGTP triphosphohydrolase
MVVSMVIKDKNANSSRAKAWAETMHGHSVDADVEIRLAHSDSWAGSGSRELVDRRKREELEDQNLTVLATRSFGAGNRATEEEPDKFRTCFERDRDRILQTLDGIRNHSWSRPAPKTPEGEIVSWADRIAYVCHDFEDAVAAGVVTPEQLPELVRTVCGTRRDDQLRAFISAMINATAATGRVAMTSQCADALAAFRKFNYDNIYMRRESRAQAESVIVLLRALVEHYVANPKLMHSPGERDLFDPNSAEAIKLAVTYVGGMTDRFACRQAMSLLNWPESQLPQGIGTEK